ncbi:FAD-dependent monooxygenase [Glycomyces tenuis]|uniref:FAD-dependent monooxygenase n=1 Tax=Glycomyces tenuis TaxID=58116 RepID=UPI00040DE74F|nr:FAD-dependent monooxygenase [Glycomyces tenuis]
MTAVQNVLISGASIAGPALAYWLGQHGIRATLVEKAPAPRTGGYSIDLRGAAIDVAERMGVLDEIRAAITDITRIAMVDARGRTKAELDSSLLAPGDRSLEILRGDLVSLLLGAAGGAEYRYGDTITALERRDDGVRVSFDRAEPATFDLVVGADGLHSNVRGLAFGPEQPYRRFLESYVSIFTVPNHRGLDREVRLFNTPGKVLVLYQTPRAADAKALLLHRSPEETDIDRRPAEEQRRHLRAMFGGMGWETDRILSDMDQAPDFYFDSVTQIAMDRWSSGRIALLGDAGYCPSPMSGQGTTLAMVGAYVLADELARHTEPGPALAAYEGRMRPYVAANQAIADPGLAFIAPQSGLGIAARNLTLKAGPLLSVLSRFGTKLSKASESVELDAR